MNYQFKKWKIMKSILTKVRFSSNFKKNIGFKESVELSEKLIFASLKKTFIDPFSIVSHEMNNLIKSISDLIKSDHHTLNKIASYHFINEGKKIRPLVVLLLSKALLKIPIEERNRIKIDSGDVNDHQEFDSFQKNYSDENFIDKSISPINVLDGFTRVFDSSFLSKKMEDLPIPKMNCCILPKQRRLAEIVELLHTATLLHDDVLDLSQIRRGIPTGNVAFTNKMSILTGDFLLARASVAISRLRNLEVIELLSTIVANLAEGEFMQLKDSLFDVNLKINFGSKSILDFNEILKLNSNSSDDITLEHKKLLKSAFEYYIHKTYLKTASLFSKLSRATAILSGSQKSVVENCYEFGRNFGICFQLIDDLLDFTGLSSNTGKPVYSDLKSGLTTGPVLFAWMKIPKLGQIISRNFKGDNDIQIVLDAVAENDALIKTKRLAETYYKAAISNLRKLPESDARSALETLSESILNRAD